VTAARLDRRGNVVLDLSYGEGQVGGGTLGYLLNEGRNVQLDLVYTITQNAPIGLRNHRSITIKSFEQGRLSDPEVDAFSYHISGSGMKYRLYSPTQGGGRPRSAGRGKRPLIIWLHGGGEGGLLSAGYYDNESLMRANRGALGFATPEAQRIFSGAYVVAPQSQSFWLEDGPRFAPLVQEIIDDLVGSLPIDPERIYVTGCSNGGYMTMEMTTVYPDRFAAAVPICGVVAPLEPGGPTLITDDQLRQISTPTWLIASRDDTTVPPEANTIHAHDLIPGALMTLYDHVIWNGYQFPGHWSWIYVARNDPSNNGTHIWQWMAQQRR
jgi:predicted peptidase